MHSRNGAASGVSLLPHERHGVRDLGPRGTIAVHQMSVVGEAGTPSDAIAGILRSHPQYVLLDYQLEGGTGLDVLRAVHPQDPGVVFIVLTNHATPQYRHACHEAGARHFLDKSSEFGRIKEVISGLETAPH